jgi:hypothetical protein
MRSLHWRLCFDALLFLAVFVMPFFVTLAFAILGLLLYPRYGEAVVAGIMIELLYRGNGSDQLGSHLLLAVWALLALSLVELLRTVVRERAR